MTIFFIGFSRVILQVDSVIMVRSEVGSCPRIVKPFKHLLCASVYPQILVLELQAPMGTCTGNTVYIACVLCYCSHNVYVLSSCGVS